MLYGIGATGMYYILCKVVFGASFENVSVSIVEVICLHYLYARLFVRMPAKNVLMLPTDRSTTSRQSGAASLL